MQETFDVNFQNNQKIEDINLSSFDKNNNIVSEKHLKINIKNEDSLKITKNFDSANRIDMINNKNFSFQNNRNPDTLIEINKNRQEKILFKEENSKKNFKKEINRKYSENTNIESSSKSKEFNKTSFDLNLKNEIDNNNLEKHIIRSKSDENLKKTTAENYAFKTIKNKTTNARQKYNLGCLKYYELEFTSYFNDPFKIIEQKNKIKNPDEKKISSCTQIDDYVEIFIYLLKYKFDEFQYFKKPELENNNNNNTFIPTVKESILKENKEKIENKFKDIEILNYPNYHPIGFIFTKYIGDDIPIDLTNSEFWNDNEIIIQEKIYIIFYKKCKLKKRDLRKIYDFNIFFFNDFSLEKK